MSTPFQETIRGRASRWWGRNVTDRLDTRRGTATVKAAFAQAARDVRKQTDPRILRAIGNAGLSKADLQLLAQAQVEARYGGRDGGFAGALEQRAQALVQEAASRRRSLLSYVPGVNRFNQWRAERRGAAALKGAYAQAARDVKRTMDPEARREVGAQRITKFELRQLMQADMADALRPSERGFDRSEAPEVTGSGRPDQQLGGQQGINPQAERPQAEGQQTPQAQPQQTPQAQTQGQAEATPQGRSRLQQAAYRLGAAVGTASRWASDIQSGATEAARQFRAAYNERRQNPTSENAQQNGERVPAREIIERIQAETGQQTGPQTTQQTGERVPARDIIERVQAENAATAAQAATDPQVKAELAETMRRGLDNTPSGFQSVPQFDPAATAELPKVGTEAAQDANAQNPTSKWVHQGRPLASEKPDPAVTSGQGEAQRTGGDHQQAGPKREGNGRGGR